MTTHGAAAKSARLNKERHPENYCAVRGCLWRTFGRDGPSPCRKHPVGARAMAEFDHVRLDPVGDRTDDEVYRNDDASYVIDYRGTGTAGRLPGED